jgi:ribulose-phosphate 3-epimerase
VVGERDIQSIAIGPSILTANWLFLGREIEEADAAGADFLHLDIMDGHFVPNITFGPQMVESIRPVTRLPVDVHLMIESPERYIDSFAEAGADLITIHYETATHLHATITQIRAAGAVPGVSINPLTPVTVLEDVIPLVGQILVMSVNPGFGGQTFIPGSLARIEQVRSIIEERNPDCRLEVDGGINERTISKVVAAGADTIVAGSAIFNEAGSVRDNLRALRSAAQSAANA